MSLPGAFDLDTYYLEPCLGDAAKPRKTRMALFRRSRSSSLRRPKRRPRLALRTVVILSTMRRDGVRSPEAGLGFTSSLNNGASVVSLVKPQMVTESVAANRSSWTITAGRGFEA